MLMPLGLLSQGGGAGGAGAFELIQTAYGTGSSGTISFTSIPATYTHLQLRITARTDGSGASTLMRFNSDSGSNYVLHYLYSGGSGGSLSQTGIGANVTDSAASTGMYSHLIVDLLDYANTNKNKTTRASDSYQAATSYAFMYSGLWLNTAAISTLTFAAVSGNFTTASRFSLYGIRGA